MSDDLVKRLRYDHPDQLTCEAADRIKELEAKNARLREAQAWRPIETAPRDGTKILGFWQYVIEAFSCYYYPGDSAKTCGQRVIYWAPEYNGWTDDEGDIHTYRAKGNNGLFTHWMPLPEPPQEADK